MDLGDRVVAGGRGERGLHLARHRLRRGVADEVADVRAGVRGDVELLARQHAGPRVAGHVAHRVAAALPARESGVAELADQLGRVGQRDVVHLDVLARGDVALAQRHVLLDHVGERVELIRGHATERQLDAHHLHVGLALAVDALLEAELDERVLLDRRPAGSGSTRCRSRRTPARGSGSRGRARSGAPRGSPACRSEGGRCVASDGSFCVLGSEAGSMVILRVGVEAEPANLAKADLVTAVFGRRRRRAGSGWPAQAESGARGSACRSREPLPAEPSSAS